MGAVEELAVVSAVEEVGRVGGGSAAAGKKRRRSTGRWKDGLEGRVDHVLAG